MLGLATLRCAAPAVRFWPTVCATRIQEHYRLLSLFLILYILTLVPTRRRILLHRFIACLLLVFLPSCPRPQCRVLLPDGPCPALRERLAARPRH